MRLVLALGLVAAATVLAGCELDGPAESANVVTVTAPQAPEPAPQLCVNAQTGWVLEYPGSWHTNADGAAPACTFFHPSEFAVSEHPEALVVAISVIRDRAPFVVAVTDGFRRDVRAQDFEVDGRPARRTEFTATGEALLPEGMRVYEIVVDLGGDTLIATLRDVSGFEWERGKRILDRMVAGIRLDP